MTADELRALSQRHGWAFPVRIENGRARIEPVSDVLVMFFGQRWQSEYTWAPACKRSNDC